MIRASLGILVGLLVAFSAGGLLPDVAHAGGLAPGVWYRFTWRGEPFDPYLSTRGCPAPPLYSGMVWACEEWYLHRPLADISLPSGPPPFFLEVPEPGAKFQVKHIDSSTPYLAEDFDIVDGVFGSPSNYREPGACECFVGVNAVLLRPGFHELWIIPTVDYAFEPLSDGFIGQGLGVFRWDVKAIPSPEPAALLLAALILTRVLRLRVAEE